MMMMMRHFVSHFARSRAGLRGARARAISSSAAARSGVIEEFPTEEAHLAFLNTQARLPSGFSCGTRTFRFNPKELPTMDASMTLSLLALDDPDGTASWSAMFTKNAFPGSPVLVGRELLARQPDSRLRGLCVNNKISNVFPGGSGVQDAKDVAAAALATLPQKSSSSSSTNGVIADAAAILPSSTGVIGK